MACIFTYSTAVSSTELVTESLSPCPTPSMPLCEEKKRESNCKCSKRPKLNGFSCFPSMGVCKCGRKINVCEWKCSGDANLPWPTPTPTYRCGKCIYIRLHKICMLDLQLLQCVFYEFYKKCSFFKT